MKNDDIIQHISLLSLFYPYKVGFKNKSIDSLSKKKRERKKERKKNNNSTYLPTCVTKFDKIQL